MTAGLFGLSRETIEVIRRILATEPAVERAVIFGSRAKGTQRPGSDIDLVLFGKGLDLDALGRLAARLDESSIPYQVDLCLFDMIDHDDLRAHIARVGKVFYERGANRCAD
ncbi:nucleotidyltransferase domain-containing protein [Thiobacter aerophilum]|uniref:Nucleotidyltransferase domain-containing protein n=1 Tax=Thiobacter aerophilum TaxID=3121275 RepID=A0ABV0EGC9_9BURK